MKQDQGGSIGNMSPEDHAPGRPLEITYRESPRPDDLEGVRAIVESSGFFSPSEIEMARELVQERLSRGISSGYYFLFAEGDGKVMGYTCFGPVPCTEESYDLYWIAVGNDLRGSGIGKDLLRRTEGIIRGRGGRRVYVETSSRELYRPTHAFYLASGYIREAVLRDFYSPGDDKVIFSKALEGSRGGDGESRIPIRTLTSPVLLG